MIDSYTIHLPNNLEELYLECHQKRCVKISKLFQLGETYYFSSSFIENEYMKPLINPTVLYITMLPNNELTPDSIIRIDILENDIKITLYCENDTISGINPDVELLHKLKITLKSKYELQNQTNISSRQIMNKIDKLRVEKDIWELLQITDAIEKTNEGFKSMFSLMNKPNLNEADLEATFMKSILEKGFYVSYLPICAGDKNGAFIHYSKNNANIINNVLLDCGARNPYGYCADITRCYTRNVDNPLFKMVRLIVSNVKTACEQYIEKTLLLGLIPSFDEMNQIAQNTFIHELPKILPKEIKVDSSIVDEFFTHSIGHHIGLINHDINSNKLIPGSVFTIEPGLYFNRTQTTIEIDPNLFNLGGIRLEDMYYITQDMEFVCLSCDIK
jgi:Xaa-Pro aminopeptidase